MRAPETIRQRRDFLAANQGRRVPSAGFVLLVRQRDDGTPLMRAGYTVTKKIGNAVVRNRVKRRLRELARLRLEGEARPGHDYVLIGRAPTFSRAYPDLEKDLVSALKRLHRTAQMPADKGTP